MLFGWSKTPVSPIAVDFGADRLKLLQVTATDPPQLVAAASAEVPDEVRADPAARREFFAETLRQIIHSQPFSGRRAALAIPAYSTLVQHLQIAKNDDDDLVAQIGLQLRERWNIDPLRMEIRHFHVGQVLREGVAKDEVICLAASRDVVMRHIETARYARLDVVGMHSEPQCILKAFAHLYRRNEDRERTTCFIDMGALTTKVIITHGMEMVFAKTLHVAGDHFTKQLAQASGLSFSQARKQRMQEGKAGAAGPDRAHGAVATALTLARPGATPSSVAGTGMTVPADSGGDALTLLVEELQLGLRYHQNMFPQRPVEKLVFLGGEAHHLDLCEQVARALHIGAQLGDPLARLVRAATAQTPVSIDMRIPQPAWAVPLGLCLSEAAV